MMNRKRVFSVILLGLTTALVPFAAVAAEAPVDNSYYESLLKKAIGSDSVKITHVRDRLKQYNPILAFRGDPTDYKLIEFLATQGGETYRLRCKMDVLRVDRKVAEYQVSKNCKAALKDARKKRFSKISKAEAEALFKLPAKFSLAPNGGELRSPRMGVFQRMVKDISDHYEGKFHPSGSSVSTASTGSSSNPDNLASEATSGVSLEN